MHLLRIPTAYVDWYFGDKYILNVCSMPCPLFMTRDIRLHKTKTLSHKLESYCRQNAYTHNIARRVTEQCISYNLKFK